MYRLHWLFLSSGLQVDCNAKKRNVWSIWQQFGVQHPGSAWYLLSLISSFFHQKLSKYLIIYRKRKWHIFFINLWLTVVAYLSQCLECYNRPPRISDAGRTEVRAAIMLLTFRNLGLFICRFSLFFYTQGQNSIYSQSVDFCCKTDA